MAPRSGTSSWPTCANETRALLAERLCDPAAALAAAVNQNRRMLGMPVADADDADAFEHACRVRDELLAIPHDWTAADPRRDASDETMAAVRAVWAREHARRGEP